MAMTHHHGFQTFEGGDSYFRNSSGDNIAISALSLRPAHRPHHDELQDHHGVDDDDDEGDVILRHHHLDVVEHRHLPVSSGSGGGMLRESDSMPNAQEISTSESSSGGGGGVVGGGGGGGGGGGSPSPRRIGGGGGIRALYPSSSAGEGKKKTNSKAPSSPSSGSSNVAAAWNAYAASRGAATTTPTRKPGSAGRGAPGNARGGSAGEGEGGDEASMSSVPFDQRQQEERRDAALAVSSGAAVRGIGGVRPYGSLGSAYGRTSAAATSAAAAASSPSSRPFDEETERDDGGDDVDDFAAAVAAASPPDDVEENYHLQSDSQIVDDDDDDDDLRRRRLLNSEREVHTDVEDAATAPLQQPAGVAGAGLNRSHRDYHSDHEDPLYRVNLQMRMPPPRISDPMLFPYASTEYGGVEGAAGRVQPPTTSDAMATMMEGELPSLQIVTSAGAYDRRQLVPDDEVADASIDVNLDENTEGKHSIESAGFGGGRNETASYEEFDIHGNGNINNGHPLGLNTSHHDVGRRGYSWQGRDAPPPAAVATTTTEDDDDDDDDDDEEADEDDSLFDFEERASKRMLRESKNKLQQQQRTSKKRGGGVGSASSNGGGRRTGAGRSKYSGREGHEDFDDDDDDDDDYDDFDDDASYEVRVSLTERAQAAWKRKSARRKGGGDSAARRGGKSPRASASSVDAAGVGDSSNHVVHFNTDDVVHRFEPDETTLTENDTIGGRSLNSEYTKSPESEVEDLIKDIFMIGNGKGNNPGRRKIKYSPHVREKLRKRQEDFGKRRCAVVAEGVRNSSVSGTDEDDTMEEITYEEEDEDEDEFVTESSAPSSMIQQQSRRRDHQRRASRRASDTASGDSSSSRLILDEKKDDDDDPLSSVWNYMDVGINAVSQAIGLDDDAPLESKCGPPAAAVKDKAKSCSSRKLPTRSSEVKGKGGMQCLFQGVSDFILGTTGSGSSCDVDLPVVSGDGDQDVLKSAPSLEEDVRLVDLALQAARSTHKLRGYEFDESYDINIVSDIKFCVVDLNLPLGLIFQENETGCWVTKVLPDGHAIKTGLVEVGDQLAAVDGVSAIHMKVDQISKIIKRKSEDIELTFLRYIGPLRPAAGTIAEEGYEIKAAEKAAASRSPAGSAVSHKRVGFLGIRKLGSTKDGATSPDSKSKSNMSVRSPTASTAAKSAASPEKKRGFRLFGRKKN